MKMKMIVFVIAAAVSASAFCFASCMEEVTVLGTEFSDKDVSSDSDDGEAAEETVTEEEQDAGSAEEEEGKEVACNHVLVYREYVAATCKTDGNEAYWYCTECSNCYYDEDASATVDMEDIVIEKSGEHSGGWRALGTYDCTATTEWLLECTVCETRISDVVEAGEHVYGEWKVTTDATCQSAGVKARTCINCGKTQTEEVEQLDHDYEEVIGQEQTCTEAGITYNKCSNCGEIRDCEYSEAPGHDFRKDEEKAATCTEGGYTVYKCSNCDYEYKKDTAATKHKYDSEDGITYTCEYCSESYTEQNLSYTLIYEPTDDGDGYIVQGLEDGGECADLVIPEYYNGLPVTGIAEKAFYGNTDIISVTIGANVTTIGGSAFYGCTSLQSVYIPESVTTFGQNAFYGCTALTTIYYNAVSAVIEGGAVDTFRSAGGNGSGITLYVGSAVVKIPDNLFTDAGQSGAAANIIEIVFVGESSLETIGENAFAGCAKLTSVTIPSTCTSIGEGAFMNCTSLSYAKVPASAEFSKEYVFYNVSKNFNLETY